MTIGMDLKKLTKRVYLHTKRLQSSDGRTHHQGRLSTCTEGVNIVRIENSRLIPQSVLED